VAQHDESSQHEGDISARRRCSNHERFRILLECGAAPVASKSQMSPLPEPAALMLDAGNTVVFLACDVVAALLGELGHAVTPAAVEAALAPAQRAYAAELQVGRAHEDGWRGYMQALVCAAGVPRRAAPAAVERLRVEHDGFNLWRRVPPEVPGALERVRSRGIPLALVSNSEGKLGALLQRIGLGEAFDLVVDSALEGVRKPDPEIFWRACRRLGVEPARCLYAGDIPDVDVVGARRAGLEAVLIDAVGIHPDYRQAPRYASLGELVAVLLDDPISDG
jgi:putative hydrolase of the HAD superfamily